MRDLLGNTIIIQCPNKAAKNIICKTFKFKTNEGNLTLYSVREKEKKKELIWWNNEFLFE